jgi:glycosyltransferase involved in cell wall biosynthesis
MVIGNGIDETEFRLVPNERDALRRQLGIGQDEVVVGTVGRFHLAKGSDRFLALMSKLADRDPRVHVLCVGRGMDWSNPEVAAAPGISQIRDRCHMVGEQAEVPRYLSAMDIFVSPSRTEGFPNALAEAMMVGLPCVATDVGASAIVLGDAGALVGCDDIDGLAIAVRKQLQMTSEQRRDMGAAARRHAVDICSVQQCVQEYSSLYSSLFRGKEVS